MKAVRAVIVLPPDEIGRIGDHARKGDGRKETFRNDFDLWRLELKNFKKQSAADTDMIIQRASVSVLVSSYW